ncbi:hypothetical protein ACFV6G_08890 [Streptomyces lavendulae]|uniref:hypothetical protein n=1 Tax=Streptomyces lavendulae TaxID=1914 RepID=UPI0036B6700D
MIRTVVLDVGETLIHDDRYWAGWADWLDVPRHTLSALVGAVVVDGRDNADALRLLRPGIDVGAEYRDVFPAAAVGLMTAHLRRGPWGHWWADDETVQQVADYSVDSLLDLPGLVDPGWRGGGQG